MHVPCLEAGIQVYRHPWWHWQTPLFLLGVGHQNEGKHVNRQLRWSQWGWVVVACCMGGTKKLTGQHILLDWITGLDYWI